MNKIVQYVNTIIGTVSIMVSGGALFGILSLNFKYGELWTILWIGLILICCLLGLSLIGRGVNPIIKQV